MMCVPGQFSWPVDLPLGYRVDGVLEDGASFPWSSQLPHATYLFKNPQFGYASECVLFHKKSKTLLCTDAVCACRTYLCVSNAACQVMYVDERTPDIPSALQVLFLSPPVMSKDTVFKRLVVVPALERWADLRPPCRICCSYRTPSLCQICVSQGQSNDPRLGQQDLPVELQGSGTSTFLSACPSFAWGQFSSQC
jgi:hypothetical protein